MDDLRLGSAFVTLELVWSPETEGCPAHRRRRIAAAANGPVHTGKLITKAFAALPWITIKWLPEHAPELNDIEPLLAR